ncbi:TRAP transporter small permease subunit [Vibrio mangrovi]|uniref:TRAP transporter small permease protein n=1 Tax=Vibrio mangrovi TaxID=474394 RepID=A0A1Y6IXF4_9VIBR|nr:TRAP transporter small permease [Vibrio mangrovi]MDW6002932.1 TRAP transporter small permease [Vibrio mangrovi]SMS01172.1 Tripartite ATP-independent periplasmic transporters, DctQ component [Vibrio mangrovi]
MVEPILRGYCQVVRYVVGLIGRSVSYLLPVLATIVAYEVFARYVIDKPTIWGYDTSLFLFGYIAALGGAYAQQREAHINVDIVHGKVPEKTRRIFDLITAVLAMGFLAVMIKTCYGMFLESLQYHYKTQSEWAPPMNHFWLMITVSATIFIAQYSTEFISNLFFLATGRELNGKVHPHVSLDDQPFHVSLDDEPFNSDSHQVEKSVFDKENPNGN